VQTQTHLKATNMSHDHNSVPHSNRITGGSSVPALENTRQVPLATDTTTMKKEAFPTATTSDHSATHFNYDNSNHKSLPKDIITVSVHPTVTIIKDHTFEKCSSLTTIIIPDKVTTIGESAFSGCTSLAAINIPDQVTTIVHAAFSRCTSLTSINIPNQVTTIGSYTFFGCTSLTAITIPDQVHTIGKRAFCECTSLASINISGDQVTTIESYAFSRCSSLTTIIIPDQVTTIGEGAFSGCTSLVTINIPHQVTRIRSRTFSECTSLTTIVIPDQVTTIGGSAFSGCTSLASITIPDQVTTIIGYGAFKGCTSLTSVIIPDQVTTIGYAAFSGCTSLITITIPDQVTTVGSLAFDGCITFKKRQPNGKNYHPNTVVWLHQRFNDLPLHQACYKSNNTNTLATSTSILHKLIQQHSASALTSTDAMLMTPLHILCCNPTTALEMIQMLKAAQPYAASMKNVMNKTPLMMLLESKNEKYSTFHDERGQLLPLVGLLEQGLDFDALEMIKSVSSNDMVFVSELQRNDEISGLLPFMYGASLGNCGLDVVYELAMKICPTLLTTMQ
jgi:hypothetical protein